MATTEHTINDELAAVLRTTRRAWQKGRVVCSENTGMLVSGSGQPDILIAEPNVLPVIIETEVLPATSVEADARARLGEKLRSNGRSVLSVLAVRLPRRLPQKSTADLRKAIEDAHDLGVALYTGTSPGAYQRWPEKGWIECSASGMSILAQSAFAPAVAVEAAAKSLVAGVTAAAGILGEMASAHPGAIRKICQALRQEDGEQTRSMAAAILVNAFIFHDSLAGGPGDLATVQNVEQLRDASGNVSKAALLAEWRKILNVNYWPVFDIALRILMEVPQSSSDSLLNQLAVTAGALVGTWLTLSHDLTGAVFQKLISDRKLLAAFYTTPASAALLAGLALDAKETPARKSWSNADDVAALHIGDFACGTGTLLSAAYQRVGQLHELAGGDAEALHPRMMAEALVGCDVLPAATHLTASMLASAHPSTKYSDSRIYTVLYGKQPDGTVALGSLELLDQDAKLPYLTITAAAVGGTGQTNHNPRATLPHGTFDLVIMNPPFTRATGQEGRKVGIPNAMFAAFGSTEDDQRAMSKLTTRLTKNTLVDGNAGEPSMFLLLADLKLRQGGTLALVMPVSLVSGAAWEKSRQRLWESYSDLVVVSIAGVEGSALSFSADTGMGECLVVGRRLRCETKRATFVVLATPPGSPMVGATAAQQIRDAVSGATLRRLEDGPVGGTPLTFGDDLIGYAIDAPLPRTGGWMLARFREVSLAQVAYQLCEVQRVWLPGMDESQAVHVPMARIKDIAEVGPYHMDVNGDTADGQVRGPFCISPVAAGTVPTYPVLWSHDADRERTMQFEAESEGVVRQGQNAKENAAIRQKVAHLTSTASHCHFNRDFRFNSQSTPMQFTTRRTMGGRAWLSLKLKTDDQEKALTAWGNTSLGLLLYWNHANKQQGGRGSIGKSALHTLVTLDVAALSGAQLAAAVAIFEDFRAQSLRPLNELTSDAVRQELDERFAAEVLGLPASMAAASGPLGLLRAKLASEPSIQGSKYP